eukprot:14468442-Ditylum_brightwellii.AAC.1
MAADMVIAKKAFEQMATGHNVSIQQYHRKKRIFHSKLWKVHCDNMGQHPTLMKVGWMHTIKMILPNGQLALLCGQQEP